MAGIEDVKKVAKALVGPVADRRSRAWNERIVLPYVHSFLLGGYASVTDEPSAPVGQVNSRADFRFGDRPHGANPCLLEIAVRGTETAQNALSQSTNRSELRKLSRYPASKANGGRILLLLDFAHDPLEKTNMQADYANYYLGQGKFQRSTVSVVYVHRDLDYRFTWSPFAPQ